MGASEDLVKDRKSWGEAINRPTGGSGTQNVTRINKWEPRRTFLSVILRVVINSIGNVFIDRLRLLLKGYWIIHPNILYS